MFFFNSCKIQSLIKPNSFLCAPGDDNNSHPMYHVNFCLVTLAPVGEDELPYDEESVRRCKFGDRQPMLKCTEFCPMVTKDFKQFRTFHEDIMTVVQDSRYV